jgi:hypothetical protein
MLMVSNMAVVGGLLVVMPVRARARHRMLESPTQQAYVIMIPP